MTFLGQDKPLLEDVIEHHGVKGQKWGVRRSNGGSIPSGAKRHMEKAETRFQAKRSAANSQVAKNRVAGKIDPKASAKASELNAQHRKNQIALQKAGLEVYKKTPDAVKKTKVSDVKKNNSKTFTKGQKVALNILAGPLAAHYIVNK